MNRNGIGVKGPFTGFTFNGVHSSDLGITRVSGSNLYSSNILPNFQDISAAVPGGDGTYYWGSNFTQKPFPVSIAFDNVSEIQFRRLKTVLSTKDISDLIFDEEPYKVYSAKIQSAPQLSWICFNDDEGRSIYKGNGTLTFVSYYPFARNRFKTLEEYNLDNVLGWRNIRLEYAGMANYDVYVSDMATAKSGESLTCYDYDYNISIDNTETMVLLHLKYDSLNVLLQKMAMIDGIYFVDRDNNITIKNIDETIKEQLTKNVLLKDIKYSNIDNKKGIKFLDRQTKSEAKASEIVYEYELTKTEEEICITSNSMNLFGATATATNVDTINVISDNFFSIIFLKLTGTVGATATITISTQSEYTTNETELDYGEKKSNIAIDNNLYLALYSNNYSAFIEKIPTYKVELEYNGNPLIKAGDYIEVESNYGKVPIFVQKHTLKYNGGLSGSIEGVE